MLTKVLHIISGHFRSSSYIWELHTASLFYDSILACGPDWSQALDPREFWDCMCAASHLAFLLIFKEKELKPG